MFASFNEKIGLLKKFPFTNGQVAAGLTLLFILLVISFYNYLLFHNIAEMFSIVIACGIFMIACNTSKFMETHYLLFIGIAYLFVGILDAVHTFTYKGMVIFEGLGEDVPTQLWIAARYMESLSLLAAPMFFRKKINSWYALAAYSVITALVLLSILYWRIFPSCFSEQTGLTDFKKISEYMISGILILSLVHLLKYRRQLDASVLDNVVPSILFTIGSELAFTFYVDAYGISNFVGHYLKIISYFFIYKAMIETGLRKPYSFLFRELKQSRERYRSLFTHMTNGFALQEVMFDYMGRPSDYIFLEVNDAFEKLTGLKKDLVAGRRLTEVMPGIEKDSAGWIEKFGAVVATGKPMRVENYSEMLGRWYSVAAYSPEEGFLMVVFEDITERKLAEEEILQTRDLLEKRVEKRTAELERMNRELSASEKQLRFLSTKLMSAQEQERKRIAGDLHDGVCSSMAAVKFGLEEALERCAFDEKMASTIENLVRATVHSISEMRRIMADLHPHLLEEMGYIAAVDRFIRDFRRIYARIEVERKMDIHENEIPEHLKIVLFRITQEAFNNIAKHSKATAVRFSVSKWGDIIELYIKDNGKGFDTNSVMTISNAHEGFGLPGMIERAELNGGNFEVESAPGQGTTIRVYFTETKRAEARLGGCG